MTLLITGGTIVSADLSEPIVADIRIEGNTIVEIGRDLEVGDEVIDADGALVMPGLIDTHTHAWQYAFRGGLARGNGFLDYVRKFETYRGRFTPQDTYDSVRGCSLAQLNAGVTGVLDFAHGANQTPDHVHAALEAHASTGQRTLLSVGSTGYVDEAVDPRTFEASRQERLELVRALSAGTGSDTVKAGLGLLTPTALHPQRVVDEIDFGRSIDVLMTFHQNRPGEISLISDAGRLGSDLTVVHSNTAKMEEVAMLAASSTALSITPESEVGAGWSPHIMRNAIRAGVAVGLGIDTPSTQSVDLWEQIRVLLLLTKALDGEAARQVGRYPIDAALETSTLTFESVLAVATRGGAQSLWGPDAKLGTIAVDSLADLIVVRPEDPDLALADPAVYLVQYGSPAQVESVVVDGQVRKRAFELVGVDRHELADRNREVRHRVMHAAGAE